MKTNRNGPTMELSKFARDERVLLWDKYFGIVDYTNVWVASKTCATMVTKMLVAMVNVPGLTIDSG